MPACQYPTPAGVGVLFFSQQKIEIIYYYFFRLGAFPTRKMQRPPRAHLLREPPARAQPPFIAGKNPPRRGWGGNYFFHNKKCGDHPAPGRIFPAGVLLPTRKMRRRGGDPRAAPICCGKEPARRGKATPHPGRGGGIIFPTTTYCGGRGETPGGPRPIYCGKEPARLGAFSTTKNAAAGESPRPARAHLLRERTRPAGEKPPPTPAGVGVVFPTTKMPRRGRAPRPARAGRKMRRPAPAHLLRERTRPAGASHPPPRQGWGVIIFPTTKNRNNILLFFFGG